MKYRNKYRIESVRKKGFNYSSPGLYFITANIRFHNCLFGVVIHDEMELSPIGEFAERYWLEIPEHFPTVRLKEHVVMPNHVHGIIEIAEGPDFNTENDQVTFQTCMNSNSKKMSVISPKAGSLAAIVRSYKSAVTRSARKILPSFEWHERYHDRIVRLEAYGEYKRIAKYVVDNPKNW